MTFKEYLSLDETVSYLEKKQDLPVDFSDLQQLERTGRIKPLVYFTEIIFSDDFFIVEFSDKPIINGYFEPHDFILLDKHRVNPYREWGNEYFEIKYDLFKVSFITQCIPNTMQLGKIGQIYNYNAPDDKGEIVSEISYYQVFIKRNELDALFETDNQSTQNHTINNKLNQRIKQLEQQLEQSSQKQGQHKQLTDRSEQSYLTTIGLLLELMTAPKGIENKPPFQSQSVIIAEIEDKGIYGQRRSSLEGRFGDANKALDNAKKKG